MTAANRYTQKGGPSSVPPFILQFRGSEKTVRNRPNPKAPEMFFNPDLTRVIHKQSLIYQYNCGIQAAILSPRLSTVVR